MNYDELLEKRAIDLTAGELAKALAIELKEQQQVSILPSYSHKGIRGIMEIFQCAKSKAVGIRASGIIDGACIQNGNSFLVDKSLALQLMREKTYKNLKHRNASSLYNNI